MTAIVIGYAIGATAAQLLPVSSHRIPIGPMISSLATPIVAAVNAVQVAQSGHGGNPTGSSGVSTAGSDEVGVCQGTSPPLGPCESLTSSTSITSCNSKFIEP